MLIPKKHLLFPLSKSFYFEPLQHILHYQSEKNQRRSNNGLLGIANLLKRNKMLCGITLSAEHFVLV